MPADDAPPPTLSAEPEADPKARRARKFQEAVAAGMRFPHPEPPPPGEAIEVAPGILWARLPLPMALDHVNVYLLRDGDAWTAVDTGMNTSECRDAWRALIEGPLAGVAPWRVIATHLHPDHMGLAGWLAREYGAELWCTRTSFTYARMLQLDAWTDLPPEAEAFFRHCGFDEARMEIAQKRAKYGFARVCAPLPLGFRRIVAGDRLAIGERSWRIVQGDGHAPEHACLYCDDENLLLAGDQVLPRITSVIAVYVTEAYSDPLSEWLESCRKMKRMIDGDAFVLSGHNEPFYGLHIRLDQLLDHHAESLDRLAAFLSEPRKVVDIYEVLFQRRIGESLQGFANAESVSHLNHLEATGRARRWLHEDGAWRFQAI